MSDNVIPEQEDEEGSSPVNPFDIVTENPTEFNDESTTTTEEEYAEYSNDTIDVIGKELESSEIGENDVNKEEHEEFEERYDDANDDADADSGDDDENDCQEYDKGDNNNGNNAHKTNIVGEERSDTDINEVGQADTLVAHVDGHGVVDIGKNEDWKDMMLGDQMIIRDTTTVDPIDEDSRKWAQYFNEVVGKDNVEPSPIASKQVKVETQPKAADNVRKDLEQTTDEQLRQFSSMADKMMKLFQVTKQAGQTGGVPMVVGDTPGGSQLSGNFWLEQPQIHFNYYNTEKGLGLARSVDGVTYGANVIYRPTGENSDNVRDESFNYDNYDDRVSAYNRKAQTTDDGMAKKLNKLETDIKRSKVGFDDLGSEMLQTRRELEHEMLRLYDYVRKIGGDETPAPTKQLGYLPDTGSQVQELSGAQTGNGASRRRGRMIHNCNFERGDTCNWSNTTYKDIITRKCWMRKSGCTPVQNTGPCRDHTTNSTRGHYLYMSAMHCGEEEYSEVISPMIKFNADSEGHCLELWYQMQGRDTDFMAVHVVPKNRQGRRKMWHIRERWQDHKPAAWKMARLTIPKIFRFYQLVIRGRSLGAEGDIGIDDITITEGPC
ncbi:PREDICTED: uncharacterized protein LOC106814952 [Priapulus caudatus]|uniref:Uncharacterized protein LOC106814952 n=1 Tax=Priapulus caudatus TaxID=37621 RepID=A0ABM1ERL4_PRICU|nr:PREDICTED: uncharacterized protein LOC106814952 [Priapulus caudatus]